MDNKLNSKRSYACAFGKAPVHCGSHTTVLPFPGGPNPSVLARWYMCFFSLLCKKFLATVIEGRKGNKRMYMIFFLDVLQLLCMSYHT